MPPGDGNLFIQWELAHHLLDLIPEALKQLSLVDQLLAPYELLDPYLKYSLWRLALQL
jgi:hypothetical protein